MPFLSLYRKYRPGKFSDLVGQHHVVKTLKNALENDRINHAYLFAGPRGTGKTSTAKVLARALNCEDNSNLEPCGECENCQRIASGQSIDVIEIDAASNRGIDEIRELREKVKFYPSEGEYKVYIIDEVHMLTKGAFNALLKTLEEPPDNVVFILATTEPHRVISTILSRCQRFDFTLLSVNDIEERLAYICENEGLEYESEALNLIAHSSNGGLRDAISILDQSISFTGGEITADELRDMLGKIDIGILKQFTKYISEKDTSNALKLINELVEKGKSVSRFLTDLIEHCRQLLLIKECGINSGLLEFPPARLKLMRKESKLLSSSRLTHIIEVLTGIEKDLKFSNQEQLLLEMGIVKITSPEADSSLKGLESRVSELEYKLRQLQSGAGEVKAKEVETQHRKVQQKTETKKIKAREKDIDKNIETEKKEVNNQQSDKTKDAAGDEDLTLEEVKKAWPTILKLLREENIKAHAFLVEGEPAQVGNKRIFIEFETDKKFHKSGAEKNKNLVKKLCTRVLDKTCQPVFVMAGEYNTEQPAVDNSGGGKKKLKNDDLVQKIVEMFDGEVIKARDDILEN